MRESGVNPHGRKSYAQRHPAFLAAILGFFSRVRRSVPARVEALVVKYRDDAPASEAVAQLSFAAQSRIAQALQSGFVLTGRTSDGAYRFELHPSLSIDAARAALNRIRLDGTVLYANQEGRSAGTPPATARATAKSLSASPATDQLIVKYRDQKLAASAQAGAPPSPAQLDAIGNVVGQPVGFVRVTGGGEYVVSLFRAVDAERAASMAALLAQRPDVEYAEPDTRMSYLLTPNDPLYANQWDFFDPVAGVNLPGAWNLTTGSASIYVGVIDTGILPHPDLQGRFIGGYDFVASTLISNDGDGRDADATDPGDWVTQADVNSGNFTDCDVASSSWHGTHVAGTIGAIANNGLGVAGINWNSKIVPLRVLGKCFGYTSDIADAIRWGAGLAVSGAPANPYPARVLNLSLGGGGACGSTFQNAINAALAAPGGGAVIAIAAGNSSSDAANQSPGNCNGVITVAALASNGARASYSNFGAVVEIAAPGNIIVSTLNNGTTSANSNGYNYAYYSGTSMATPHVAGIASLMLSVNPGLTPAQVLAKIQTTTRAFVTGTGNDCTTSICGAGMIDASAAVAASLPSGTSSTSVASSGTPSTLGASVTFTATVSGSNPTGTVSFTDGGTAISGCATQALSGTGNSRTATCSTTVLTLGTHTIAAIYSGGGGNASSTSAGLSQVVNAVASGTNVALASAGGVASASSSLGAGYPIAALNNGERKGTGWGSGGGWADGTPGAFPDWVQINFNGVKTIDRVVLYTVQDNYENPIEPTDTLTFGAYGNTDFTVQGWDGVAWVTLGSVTGNNLVKRTVSFAAYTTDRIRVNISNARNAWSLLTEVEAFGGAASLPATATSLATSGTPSTLGASVTFTATVSGSNPTGAVNFTDGGTAISGCATQALSGTGNTRTATCSTTALTLGTHTIAAIYSGDGGNATSSSAGLAQVVNAAASGTNVALASAGGVASASSSLGAGYPIAALNNGERKGTGWGSGGGWADGTPGAFPDWVQINFNGVKTIDRVVLYTVQDDYQNPIEPTDTLTFATYGNTDFTVQGWDGTAWVTLGSVTGNNLVKRTVTFAAYTTDRIRVNISNARNAWSLLTEVEAWGVATAPPPAAPTWRWPAPGAWPRPRVRLTRAIRLRRSTTASARAPAGAVAAAGRTAPLARSPTGCRSISMARRVSIGWCSTPSRITTRTRSSRPTR